MRVQRWIGLMAAALMLHANAKVAFAACVLADTVATTADAMESHPESDERHSGAHAGSTHHHEQTSVPDEIPSPGDERGGPGDAPPEDDCCQEINSCGGSVIPNQGTVRTATGLAPASAIAAQSEVLLGRTAAPDPPPPKA